ncbi:co-chaperone GroES [Fusobacterium russii]|uniref:co-chaperone GroES n=1 Tax=Fusobacterium russii TaxID=854 RepID=UPI0003A7DE89|nr:co-chaperone GroES [Fusobacterium russii]
MSIKPIGERVLLKPIKLEEKTASGIILSSNSTNDGGNIAEVIAIGNLEKYSEIKVGNKVIYTKFSGTEVKSNDEKYLLINAEDILAIVD